MMMKQIIVFLATLTALLFVSCGQKSRTVEFPAITKANTWTIDIEKVELNDSATVLHVKACFRPRMWIKIAPETYLRAGGKKYALVSSTGITPGEEFYMPDNGETNFMLAFEPLPISTDEFDFIEGNEEGAFHLWGVDISGKPQQKYPDGLPDEFRKDPVDGPLPDPVFCIGKTTVNLHVLNRYNENDTIWDVFVNRMDGTQDELTVKIDSAGNGSLSFEQYGTVLAVIVDKSRYPQAEVCLAPGETCEVYMDMRRSGDIIMQRRKGAEKRKVQQRMFTNGVYADFNMLNELYLRDYKGMDLFGITPYYHMTGDEYTDYIINTYKGLADSLSVKDYPRMVKEYHLARLQNECLDAMANYKRYCATNYRMVHDSWGSPVPEDSIAVTLTDSNYSSVGRLFDAGNPKLLMFANLGSVMDWSGYGAKGNLSKAIAMYREKMEKAKRMKLKDEDLQELRLLGNPFFAAACDSVMQKNVRDADKWKDSSLVRQAPDVADEKIFDAIVAPYRGKIVVVDLWNTWCAPCRSALSVIEPMKGNELKSDGIVWIYLADESSPMPKYMDMIQSINGIHYRLDADQIAAVRKRFDVDGIPYYILVDRMGKATGRPDFRDHNIMKSSLLEAIK